MGRYFRTIVLFAVLAAGCSGNSPTTPARNPEQLTSVGAAPGPVRGPAAQALSRVLAAGGGTARVSASGGSQSLGESLCQSAVNGVTCVVQSFTSSGASVLFTNAGTQPVAVNLSVYLRFEPDEFGSQVFHAEGSSRVESLGSGQSTVLNASFPTCAFQIDAYVGPHVETPPHAPETLLGYEHGGGALCENPANPGPPTGPAGCTPGFWKNHPAAWPAPYTPATALNSVFSAAPAGITLDDALNYNGSDSSGILLRAAVAALLNIVHAGVDYPVVLSDLVLVVNLVLGMDDQIKLLVKDVLDLLNNLGCPINGKGTAGGS